MVGRRDSDLGLTVAVLLTGAFGGAVFVAFVDAFRVVVAFVRGLE